MFLLLLSPFWNSDGKSCKEVTCSHSSVVLPSALEMTMTSPLMPLIIRCFSLAVPMCSSSALLASALTVTYRN